GVQDLYLRAGKTTSSVLIGDTNSGVGLYAGAAGQRIACNATGVGFNAVAPIARPDYTVTTPTVRRAINGAGSGETLVSLSNTLGTLIQDLISYGLLQ